MANNYTSFSFIVPVDDPRAVVREFERIHHGWELDSAAANHAGRDAIKHPIFPDVDDPDYLQVPDFAADADDTPPHLWFSDEAGEADLDNVAWLVKWILSSAAGAPDEVCIEWASTCSKPRVGEFGGGAMLVTKDGIASLTTGDEDIWARLRDEITADAS